MTFTRVAWWRQPPNLRCLLDGQEENGRSILVRTSKRQQASPAPAEQVLERLPSPSASTEGPGLPPNPGLVPEPSTDGTVATGGAGPEGAAVVPPGTDPARRARAELQHAYIHLAHSRAALKAIPGAPFVDLALDLEQKARLLHFNLRDRVKVWKRKVPA